MSCNMERVKRLVKGSIPNYDWVSFLSLLMVNQLPCPWMKDTSIWHMLNMSRLSSPISNSYWNKRKYVHITVFTLKSKGLSVDPTNLNSQAKECKIAQLQLQLLHNVSLCLTVELFPKLSPLLTFSVIDPHLNIKNYKRSHLLHNIT